MTQASYTGFAGAGDYDGGMTFTATGADANQASTITFPGQTVAVGDTITVNFGFGDQSAVFRGYYPDGNDEYPIVLTNNNNYLLGQSQVRSYTITQGTFTPCFCAGTLIRTICGEVPVEQLALGDVLVTADGQTRPVKWIGRHTVAARFADPVCAYPIRIAAGAIAEGVPARDLFLSPDHALLIDGVLAQAGALINGSTITRVMSPEPRFTYYHVETDDHAIILAEGTPAETFVSNVTRRAFDNYPEYEALFGERADFEAMPDRDEPRAMSARQVPATIKARLSERATVLMPVEAEAA